MDNEAQEVPLAPDPPEAPSSTLRSNGVRFLAERTPTPPPPAALSSGSSEAAITQEEDCIDPYGPRFSRGYGSEGEESYSKRGSDDAYGPRPFHYMLLGLALAATCAVLAVLPICNWKRYDAYDRRKFRYFCYGVGMGSLVFVTWAVLLVYFVKFREVDSYV